MGRGAATGGSYRTDSLEHEGFIHLSRPDQVAEVANYTYQGVADLILLCILPEKLTAELRYEALSTAKPYTHLCGPLKLSAVVRVIDFPPQEGGSFQLPTDISSSVTP